MTAVDCGSSKGCYRWFPGTVIQDGASYLREHGGAKDAVLFICWGLGLDIALAEFKGDYLAVVGEDGGCTWWPQPWQDDICYGDNDGEISEPKQKEWTKWTCIKEVMIPQWDLVHDTLAIFQRNSTRPHA